MLHIAKMRRKEGVSLEVEQVYSISVIGRRTHLRANSLGLNAIDSIGPIEIRDWVGGWGGHSHASCTHAVKVGEDVRQNLVHRLTVP